MHPPISSEEIPLCSVPAWRRGLRPLHSCHSYYNVSQQDTSSRQGPAPPGSGKSPKKLHVSANKRLDNRLKV